jgi:YgiT-type zinc finger domain-containing protein
MSAMLNIRTCPTCRSSRIRKVRKDWTGEFKDRKYTVPSLEYHECSDCGERVYEREAMRRIEEKSPALKKNKHKQAA